MENTARNTILGLFFVSGATALIYQVVWTRLLTLFFGSTVLAVSTTLAAFMGGLAIGSALFGRRADTAVKPVRFYAWLELFIGLYALATPILFSFSETAFVALHGFLSPGFWDSALIRFALALLLLLPPTILMGGTLPVLSKVFLRNRASDAGRALSVLYFVNTTGAVVGTVAAGLILLQTLGTDVLLLVTGAANVGIFLLANRMQGRVGDLPPSGAVAREAAAGAPAGWSGNAMLAAATLVVSGLAALVYEVVWTRVLTLVIGSSTYAFTIMLATFLAGIALGSAFVTVFFRDKPFRLKHLAVCQVFVGVFALATASSFGVLPDAFISLFELAAGRFAFFLTANFLLCFAVMVPATLFMGASFPIAGAIVVERVGDSGRRIGLLYAGNTVGAILGAILAGFVLLPTIGIHNTLMLTVAANLLAGSALFLFVAFQNPRPRTFATPVAAAGLVVVLAFVWQPEWNELKMTSGPYIYAPQYQVLPLEQRLSRLELLFYREGPVATVSVVQEGAHRRLVVDGKTDAGNAKDMGTQVLLGHLPFLVRPDAEDVLVIGYASGITAGAVGRHRVKSIDAVEIEPAMRDASRLFMRENYGIAADERFTLVVDDGRSYALTTKRKYDVVISEPSNPWQSGSSRLFSREAFRNASNILKPDGVMVQWMHLYGVDAETFRLVARTFVSVFPNTTLWLDPVNSDAFFIGSNGSLEIDPVATAKTYRENPRVRRSLARIGYTKEWSLLRAFLLGRGELKQYADDGKLNTDALPLLEFRAPRSLFSPTAGVDTKRALLAARSPEPFPPIRTGAGAEDAAASILLQWGEALAQAGDSAMAKGALARAAALAPNLFSVHFRLGYLRMLTGNLPGAIEAFERALRIDPSSGNAHANLGTLLLQSGKNDEALTHLRTAISLHEDSSNIRNNLAVVLARQNRLAEAVKEAEMAVSLNPQDRAAAKNLKRFRKLLRDLETR